MATLELRPELIRWLGVVNSARLAVHEKLRASTRMGECYVANLSASVGCDLFPHPLSDLAIACAVACQTDHTDRRCYPRSCLPIPASIVIAFLALCNFNVTF